MTPPSIANLSSGRPALRVRRGSRLHIVAIVGALAALAGATSVAQRSSVRVAPERIGLSPARLIEATELLKRDIADRHVAGAVAAVARHGQVGYLEALGVQDLETRAPMTDRSLFRIYSMTKSITAVAVMMLHEQKRFALDDPISTFIPEFRDIRVIGEQGRAHAPAAPITVRDLLLHTSGLNHRTSEIYRRELVRSRTITMSQFIANLVRVGLMEDPGTRYRYSEGTTVLGRLVEIWSGQPFDVFLATRILGPLKMHDTMFAALTAEQRARLTTVYGPAPGGGLTKVETETVPFTERPTLIEGAVGLLSTVPDYLRFAQMLLNKGELDGVRLLRATTVEMMTNNGLSNEVLALRGGSTGWGLANVDVAITPAANNPVRPGEFGWDGTAGTIFWIDPGHDVVTILMTASSPANPERIRQRFKALVQQAVVD